jgi:hypothetical protein
MSKEIKINPEFLGGKRNKTQKKPSGAELKKALLQSITSPGILESLDTPVQDKEVSVQDKEVPVKSTYGCLKNGTLPTYRQLRRSATTIKQYASFGKTSKSNTVRVLIKDKDTYAKIERDKKKIDKRPMSEIREYLRQRKLYKIGSTAPDDILRDIYKNAILTGNVENNSSDTLMHNFLNDA